MIRLEGGEVVFDLTTLIATGRATSRGGSSLRLVALVNDVDTSEQPLVMFNEVDRCVDLFWPNGLYLYGGHRSPKDLFTKVSVQ